MQAAPENPDLRAIAAGIAPDTLGTRLVWEAAVTIADREDLGQGPDGQRYIIPITGGRFWGGPAFPGLSGIVLPGGADRQRIRPDGVKQLEALYEMRCDDGTVLTILNRVSIDESVSPRYARSHVQVTAPEGPHAWLNRRLLVGTLNPLRPAAEAVLIRVYVLD